MKQLAIPSICCAAAVAAFMALSMPFIASAQGSSPPANPGTTVSLDDPLKGRFTSLPQFLSEVLRVVIRLGIPIAVIFIVWAGFKFVTAQGSEEKLREAKRNLGYTLIGVAIFLAAALLVEIVSGTLKQFGL